MKNNSIKISGKNKIKQNNIMFYIFCLFFILFILMTISGTLKSFVVLTDSMSPVIKSESIVYTKQTDFSKLKAGDIISFYADINLDGKKETVIHYFNSYETENGQLLARTKSYNAELLDSWKVAENDFIGIKIFSVPAIGKIIRYFSSILGFINLTAGFIIFLIIIKIFKKLKLTRV
jgi:signal peptidase I